MENKGIDRVLKETRLNLGLSLKEASKLIGISPLLLYLYEYGYFIVSKKNEPKIINAYKLNEDFFSSDLMYPVGKKKKISNYDKIFAFFKNKVFMITTAMITTIFIGLVPSSNYTFQYGDNNSYSYFDQKVIDVLEITKEKATSSEVSLARMDVFYDYTFEYEGRKYTYETFNNQRNIGFANASSNGEIGTDTYQIYTDGNHYPSFSFHRNLSDGENTLYYIDDLNYNDYLAGKDVKFLLFVASKQVNLPIEKGNEYYDTFYSEMKSYADPFFAAFESMFKNEDYNIDYSFVDFLTLKAEGQSRYDAVEDTSAYLLMASSVLSILGLGLLSFSFYLLISDHFKNKVVSEDDDEGKAIIQQKPCKTLPKNIRFTPFIPEWLIRVLGLIVLFISSIGLTVVVGTLFGILNIFDIQQALGYQSATKNLLNVAIVVLYFTVLNAFTKKKNGTFKVFMFLLLGFIYYIFETLLMYFITSEGGIIASAAESYGSMLPGNVVWGATIFTAMALFLLTTPRWASKSTKNRVVWRSMAILPVGYLVAGYLITYFTKVKMMDKLYYPISYLFVNKNIILGLFSFFTIIAIYIYHLILKHKYGKEGLELYINGNRYQLVRNLIVAVIIGLVALIDFVVPLMVENNVFKLGNNYYILTLVPFVLLYHQHIGKRNTALDLIYSLLYGIILCISYIFLICVLFL